MQAEESVSQGKVSENQKVKDLECPKSPGKVIELHASTGNLTQSQIRINPQATVLPFSPEEDHASDNLSKLSTHASTVNAEASRVIEANRVMIDE